MLRSKNYLIFIGPLLILGIWFLSSLGNSFFLPGVGETLQTLKGLFVSGKIWIDIYSTMYRTFIGLGIAIILGIPLGLVVGYYPKIYKAFEVVIDFFRSLPATAMFPLFLLFFGIGDGSKIAMSWFISFWVILVNTAHGAIYSSKVRTKVAQSFKATKWQLFRHVLLMESLPQIFIGLRTALSLSLIAVVVSEMFIGSTTGLGQRIYDSYVTYEISDLYAWLIVTGFIGYIINKSFLTFERKVLHWAGR